MASYIFCTSLHISFKGRIYHYFWHPFLAYNILHLSKATLTTAWGMRCASEYILSVMRDFVIDRQLYAEIEDIVLLKWENNGGERKKQDIVLTRKYLLNLLRLFRSNVRVAQIYYIGLPFFQRYNSFDYIIYFYRFWRIADADTIFHFAIYQIAKFFYTETTFCTFLSARNQRRGAFATFWWGKVGGNIPTAEVLSSGKNPLYSVASIDTVGSKRSHRSE